MNIVSNWNISKVNTFWIVLSLCGLNLFVMHYTVLCNGHLEGEKNFTIFVDNLLGIIIDVTVLYLFLYLVTWKRLKTGLTITYFVTTLWSFSNVLYSRFFHHYISLSAIGMGGTLFDSDIMRCVMDGLRWTDLFYVLSTSLFIFLMMKVQPIKRPIAKLLISLMTMLGIDILSYIVFFSLTPEHRYISFFIHRIEHRQLSTYLHMFDPNNAVFRRGCLRSLLNEAVLDYNNTIELTEEQKRQIEKEIEVGKNSISKERYRIAKENVIFILVESYLSFTSDMKVDGREVTPYLNSLKRDSTVFYNGKMRENVTIGESSDGQFIYMTGLLPLRSVITISKARHVTLNGLPKMLGRESRMVIPTVISMWNQDEMCRQYGFERLYESNDYAEGKYNSLNDEQVFRLAMQKDKESHRPFFSVILTMSMHQPYTKQIDLTFPVKDSSIPEDLACYLNACHYTDRQIEKYFEHLKHTGLYDNSIIVIAADHPVHNTDFGGVNKDIPLYLVNVPRDIKENMWQGECNQIDVYTTLLDLLGIESDWYGLGHSLLSPTYQSSIETEKWNVSEWIIRGDYFSNH